MRIDFSEMRDYSALEELDRLDRLVASLFILNAPDDVQEQAQRDLGLQWERIEDMYPEEADQFSIKAHLTGMQSILDHIDKMLERIDNGA